MANEAKHKHTPGPWHVTTNPAQDLVCAADEIIADCTTGDLPEVTQANARLIAAAPDLLEECKRVVSDITNIDEEDRTDLERQTLRRLTAAIVKAEGK